MNADERLTPLQAANALREMEGADERLKARVHGLTWLFWAAVCAGSFLTYSYAASVQAGAAPGQESPRWFGLLWLPWAAFGLAFTFLLWRSVGFVMPGKEPRGRELALHAIVFLLGTIGLVIVSIVTHYPVYPSTVVLLGLGIVTSILGVREAMATKGAFEPVAQVMIGVALMAFAISEAAVLAGEQTPSGLSQAALWNVGASAIALTAIGLLRILRA